MTELLGGRAVVKALVAAGRRGKAGAIVLVDSADAARVAAERQIGSEMAGLVIEQVYVEAREDIAAELYLWAPRQHTTALLVSCRGGVGIEQLHANQPDAIVTVAVDPLEGMTLGWLAAWERAGADATLLGPWQV